MTNSHLSELILSLGALFYLSCLAAGLLSKLRIPGVIGALFVAILVHHTPVGLRLISHQFDQPLIFLANLGILFLLFYIGLQVNVKELLSLGNNILWLTSSKLILTSTAITALMLALGYNWLLSTVIGLALMPTAEAVIIPILDEFRLVRTHVGEMIIGASILDDIIEIIAVALVSIWIASEKLPYNDSSIFLEIWKPIAFLIFAGLNYRYVIPLLARHWLPRRPGSHILLCTVILLGFAGLSEWAGLGLILGALGAGMAMRPTLESLGLVGEYTMQVVQSVTYGFLAQIFFFWVGLNLDLKGVIEAPIMTILLILVSFTGKIGSVLLMVPMRKITLQEAWTIGISVNAGLTTEIIVAQLLLNAHFIDTRLYTALVSASSITTVCVPLLLAAVLRVWHEQLSQQLASPTS